MIPRMRKWGFSLMRMPWDEAVKARKQGEGEFWK
jgi:hypothetical protein